MFIQERDWNKILVIRKSKKKDNHMIRAFGYVDFGGLGDVLDDEEEVELDALPINMIKYEKKEPVQAIGAGLISYMENRFSALSFADQTALNAKLVSARATLNMPEYNPLTKSQFIEITTYLQGSLVLNDAEKGMIKDIILDYTKEGVLFADEKDSPNSN